MQRTYTLVKPDGSQPGSRGTSVSKSHLFRILARDVNAIREVGPGGHGLSSITRQEREFIQRKALGPGSSVWQFRGLRSMTRGFGWSVLRLAFRITGNQTAVWSIYSEAMLKDAR